MVEMVGKKFLMYEGSQSKIWPSLYPLLMHSEVREKLIPGLYHILTVLSEDSVEIATSFVARHFHECVALVQLLIEAHCLRKYDSLFLEYIMSLQRKKLDRTTGELSLLDSKTRLFSLLLEVGLPYLKSKLDSVESSAICRVFRFAYSSVFIIYKWLYVFGRSKYFSPLLQRLNLVLVKLNPADLLKQHQQRLSSRAQTMGRMGFVGKGFMRIIWFLQDYASVISFVGVLGLEILQWSYSEEGAAHFETQTTEVTVPPPKPLQLASDRERQTKICEICQAKRKNPAACLSGYVFCYPCIYRYVNENHKCPVTGIACETKAIRRIYQDNN